jgi:hypothetical protein
MQIFLLALVLIAIAVGGFAIKMFLIPGGEFKKTCGSTFDPQTGQPKSCACASGRPEDCDNADKERVTDLIMDK